MKIEFLKVQFKENRFMQKYCRCTFILNKADLVPPNSKLHNPTVQIIAGYWNSRAISFQLYFIYLVAYSPKQKIPCNINPYLIVTAMKGQKHMNVHQNATNKPLEELILRKNKQHENLKKGQSTKDLALR